MKVADFMTSEVVTVTADTTLSTAAALMLDHKISGLPVVDATRRVVGMVSEHDLLCRHKPEGQVERLHWLQLLTASGESVWESQPFRDAKVGAVMSHDVITVAPDASLELACRLIEVHGIKRLPVVQDGVLVGIIARADLVRAFAQSIDKVSTIPLSNDSVAARLVELERQNWRSRARAQKPF